MSALEELFGLKGRVALVTGASSGLGGDAARALAKGGARVALVARRKERLEALAKELEGFAPAAALPADMTDRAQIETTFDAAEEQLGPVSILLHAAGVARLKRAEQHTRKDWDEVLAIDLTAGFELAQIFANRCFERGDDQARIIFLGSAMGTMGNAVHRTTSYTAAKHGLHGLTRQLAIEWAQRGINVNAIAPSYFPTEMTVSPETGKIPDAMRERMEIFTPMGRTGREGEIETAVLFLASPASSYVTGAVVPVDGGWTAW